jgi:hypothetical protein
MGMNSAPKVRPDRRLGVLWGFDELRSATVVEVWGDPAAPSEVRLELDRLEAVQSALLSVSPAALIDAA